MKRLALPALLLLLLCGCGFLRESSYTVVEPHDEDYGVAVDSDTLTVSSYLSLKNAILNMVEDGVTSGVIRAESYSGNLAEDLSQAVNEVWKGSPLGAFAVSSMTYDYSRIVSYYEIHINTVFRRTQEEIQSVTFVTDTNALRGQLREAMASYTPKLLLWVGDYDAFDLESEVEKIYLEHPEFALERPEATMELYPESGTQRILELKFSYAHSGEVLSSCQEELTKLVEQLAALYGSSNTDLMNARRLYLRVGRDAVLEQPQEAARSFSGSAYGVLAEEHGNCYGFAQAYRLLLEASGIPCQIITGQRNGEVHYWCLAELDGEWYYIDPSQSAGGSGGEDFLMGNAELETRGYYMWNASDYPAVELPAYLKPPAPSASPQE